MIKLTVLLLSVALFSVQVEAKAQNVTISGKNLPLKQLFAAIEKQTGYVVFAKEELLQTSSPVTLNVRELNLKQLLDIALKNQGLAFELRDRTKTIFLSRKLTQESSAQRVENAVSPEYVLISGTVKDSSGAPLQGVTIAHTRGGALKAYTFTDKKGEFGLDALEGDRLTFSFVGFESQVVQVGDETRISVVLRHVNKEMNEVQVTVNTGYQKIRPEQVTGAVSQITTKQYESQINPDFLTGLQGRLPGLLINNDVKFNGNNLFQIRGLSTISAGSQPLIVMDGYLTNLTLSDINPNEIKSVTILKDAAAAAIYGVKASNGVVVIERKEAIIGTPRINFRTTVGIKPAENYSRYRWAPGSANLDWKRFAYKDGDPTVVSPQLWSLLYSTNVNDPGMDLIYKKAAGLINQQQLEDGFRELASYDNKEDYRRLFLRSAVSQMYNINVSGGTDRATYYITGNYTDNSLNQKKNDNRQFQLSARTNLKLSRRLSLELFNDYTEYADNAAPVPDINSINAATRFQDAGGNPVPLPGSALPTYLSSLGLLPTAGVYPLTDLDEISTKNHRVDNRITANFRYALGKGLNIGFGGFYETSTTDTKNLNGEKSTLVSGLINTYTTKDATGALVYNLPRGAYLKQTNASLRSFMIRTQLDYNKSIGANHTITAIAGAEVSKTVTQSNTQSYFGYNDQTLVQQSVDYTRLLTGSFQSLSGFFLRPSLFSSYDNLFKLGYTDDRFVSGYANASYSFRNTYSLTGSIRVDQSNLFGTDPRYRYKPLWSVGAAWNIHREKFMAGLDWVHQLKLRVAEGFDGNVAKNSIPEVIARASTNNILGNNSPLNQYALSSPANGGLRWEQTENFNAGLDWSIFKGISGSIDYYIKKSTDVLGATPIDPTRGVDNAVINQASIRNKGIELKLNADWITRRNFNWYTGLALSRNTNKVLAVYNTVASYTGNYASNVWVQNLTTYVAGYPISPVFSYRSAGLDNTGKVLIYDAAGQTKAGSLATGRGDITYSGTTLPVNNIGMSNRVDIGKFYFFCMINYYGGFVTRIPRPDPSVTRPLEGAETFWRKAGDERYTDVLAYRGVTTAETYAYNNLDKYTVCGDYLTLSSVTVSYELGNIRAVKRAGFSSLQLLLQGSNLYTRGLNKFNFSQATGSYAKSYVTPTYTAGVYANF